MVTSSVPNPLANKMGVGPPIAPPNWRWRAGKLLSHMYFYTPSPEEKVIRSKRQLIKVLEGMQDAPSLEQFCWRITPEVAVRGDLVLEDALHKVYWSVRRQAFKRENMTVSLTSQNQTVIQNSDSELLPNRSSSKRQKMDSDAVDTKDHSQDPKPVEKSASRFSEARESHKKWTSKLEGKRRGNPVDFENKVIKSNSKLKISEDHEVEPSTGRRRALKSPKLEHSSSLWTITPAPISVPPSYSKSAQQHYVPSNHSPYLSRSQENLEGEKYPKSLNMPEFFRFILELPTSYEWLSNKVTLMHFLGEVERAKNLSFPQIEDIRRRIRGRKDTISKLAMYDRAVLYAFIELLGHKPHPDMNKDDLVKLFLLLRKL